MSLSPLCHHVTEAGSYEVTCVRREATGSPATCVSEHRHLLPASHARSDANRHWGRAAGSLPTTLTAHSVVHIPRSPCVVGESIPPNLCPPGTLFGNSTCADVIKVLQVKSSQV